MALKCFSWWLLVCSKSVIQDVSVLQNTVIKLEQQQRWSNLHFNFTWEARFQGCENICSKGETELLQKTENRIAAGTVTSENQYFLRVYTFFACLSLCIFTRIYVSVARLQLPSVCYLPAAPKSKVCCPLGDASYAWLRLSFLAL